MTCYLRICAENMNNTFYNIVVFLYERFSKWCRLRVELVECKPNK